MQRVTRRTFLAAAALPAVAKDAVDDDLFVAGTFGYHTYRIPSLILTRKGMLLAFCEGRRNSASDTGDIDLLLRRSIDQGKTWSTQSVVVRGAADTFGNPCPVVERKTGTVWLLLTRNPGYLTEKEIRASDPRGTRTVWVTSSTDDGAS